MKNVNILRLFIAVALVFSSSIIHAQMVGGSVFLKGSYVEAGICDKGDFGAASPPAGYHPHTVSTGGGALGFVSDPAMDGWTVGVPAYMGDYFTPGTPFEGWAVQRDTVRAQSFSCGSFIGSGGGVLTGANTAYTTSGSKVIGTWQGTFDSMTIRQETTLDTNALFFSMKMTFINNSSVPKNNIFYMRTLDPDNDQSWPGGGFYTSNTIQYQRPNPLDATVVSAVGAGYPSLSYLSLGTADTNAKCLIYSSWPIAITIDLASVYSGLNPSSTYAAGGTRNGDVAIGIVFKIDHLAPVDSASDSVGYKPTAAGLRPANQQSFTYFYAFSNDATDSALAYLTDTGTVPEPIDTTTTFVNNINTQKEITVYPNPAQTIVNISGLNAADVLQLYDMMGRPIGDDWIAADKPTNTFSLQQIPTGRYMLIVKDKHGRSKAMRPLIKN